MRNISDSLLLMLSMPPQKHDIYTLYNVYEIQQKSKVALRLYEMELHKLLANAVTFVLFALIASIICFPINRYKTRTNISIKIIISAITMRFFNNIFESFAHNGILSVQLASWAVVLILLCLSMAVLIWKEA
jgi:lipopolysaccharide export LptBFGC system permease protein LptF